MIRSSAHVLVGQRDRRHRGFALPINPMRRAHPRIPRWSVTSNDGAFGIHSVDTKKNEPGSEATEAS